MSPGQMNEIGLQYGNPEAALRAERARAESSQACLAERKSLEDLGHLIIELAGHLNAAHYRFLMLITVGGRRIGWGGDGATQSCAHWLNWKCGIDMGAAREKVRTANALVSLAKTAAAMDRGELSYAKVRALTRVACANTENTLREYAFHGTAAHVERIVRASRHCKKARNSPEMLNNRRIGNSLGFTMPMACS